MKLEKDYKRRLQLKILNIVKDIDKLCQDNDIDYYILYGSALGAIRHKGFIPWDDDFDIGMTYDNYIRFLDICEKQLDKNKYYILKRYEIRGLPERSCDEKENYGYSTWYSDAFNSSFFYRVWKISQRFYKYEDRENHKRNKKRWEDRNKNTFKIWSDKKTAFKISERNDGRRYIISRNCGNWIWFIWQGKQKALESVFKECKRSQRLCDRNLPVYRRGRSDSSICF